MAPGLKRNRLQGTRYLAAVAKKLHEAKGEKRGPFSRDPGLPQAQAGTDQQNVAWGTLRAKPLSSFCRAWLLILESWHVASAFVINE